jgi:hypothetical protein
MALACAGSVAVAEPFVYQGQLKESGAPANGEYDFRFELYDAETGGTQLGATNAFGNLEVVDGVFHVDLDFGNFAFDGSDRWLRIQVRPGLNIGAYTELTPRTPMSKAPQAQIADEALFADHAITAESVLNPQWTDAPGILWYGDGNDRVLINHDSTISSTSYFGVHADTSGDVGMTVSGLAGSDPYYAYGADGVIGAKTEFDSTSGSWRLENQGNLALAVNDDGESSFFRAVTAWLGMTSSEYKYASPKSRSVMYTGHAFHTPQNSELYVGQGVAFYEAVGGSMHAQVSLPNGARVTRMTVYCEDEAVATTMSVNLYRRGYGGFSGATLASVSTSGFFGDELTLVDSSINSPVIDNDNHGYYLVVDSFAWPGWFEDSMSLHGVKIQYTVDEAD